MKKRILSLFLALALMLTLLPAVATTANATEYSSGTTVIASSLKAGDTIRKGVILRNDLFSLRLMKTSSATSHSTDISIDWLTKNEAWTADVNYFVVRVAYEGLPQYLFLYPITETSAITFYPSGGTIQGGTVAKTFTATKYLSDYCDVSWLTPSRPGCTFLGWYTSDGKEQVYNANGIAVNGTYWKNNLWQGQGAKSFIAKWKANTSVTFRYFPNGGTGQPDNYVQWKANATYFDTYPTDSHYNYTSGTYKLTRVGYTATGYFAKKDGTCLVHEDDKFTSYPQLCAAYGLNPDTCGNATIDIYAQWAPLDYQVSFNGNGATGGTMANQAFTYHTPQALTPNAFERVHTLSFDVGGGDPLPAERVVATFDGWQDRGSIVYDGVTYAYTDFDGQGYAARNPDVTNHTGYGNGIMNKYEMIRHYITYGKAEYENGSATRAPITEQIYPYSDGQTVTNLSTTPGYTVPLYAMWTPGWVTLPAATRPGYTFKGWEGNLMENVVLLNGYEHKLNDEYGIIANPNYAVTENFVPVVGGNTYISNFEVCGLYSYDKDGMYLERSSSYSTVHTVHKDAAYVRIEVNLTKGISYEQYQNELSLMGGIPAGTNYQVGSDQTLKALWDVAYYDVVWKNHDGTVLETDKNLTYGTTPEYNGDTPIKPEDEEFTYTFSGWSPEPSPVTGNAEYTAQFTANSKCVEPTYTVTIPATAKVGEEITISATDVVLNEDETLTVTLQSDFKLYMGQDVALPFVINGGSIQNNAVILSITGNGDQTAPQTAESTPLTVTPAEDPPYAGTYTGTVTFTIAVNPAENN